MKCSRRVARRLALAPEGHGRAYRLGGDEFCVLATTTDEDGPGLIESSAAALTEAGEGFSVSCSLGAVLIPSEAKSLSEALRIADDRMYLNKQENRPGTDRQSIDVLISVLEERDSGARPPPGGRRGPGGSGRPQAAGARAAAGGDQAGRRAARRRQAGDPGGDPGQARPSGGGRVGVRPAPYGDRRANPRLGTGARPRPPRSSARPTSAGTEWAIPTGSPEPTSRKEPGSSPSATPSTP